MDSWFDTHAHLDRYGAAEREEILTRAWEAGVEVLGVAVDAASAGAMAGMGGIAGRTVGLHPLQAAAWHPGVFSRLIAAPGVLAIGECGFDDAGPDPGLQEAAFRGQCALAREHGLPLVLHIAGRRAWEMLEVRRDDLAGLAVVRHYFTGDRAQAEWHAVRGHLLSFGRPLLREVPLQATCRWYPRKLVLIETDSYPLPGRATEPRDVAGIGEAVARLWGWPAEETRRQLAENTRSAFPGIGRRAD